MNSKLSLNIVQKPETKDKNSLPKVSSFLSPRKEKNTSYLNTVWFDVQPDMLPIQVSDITNKLNRSFTPKVTQSIYVTPFPEPNPIIVNFSEDFSAGTGSWDFSSGNMKISSVADGGLNGDSYYLTNSGSAVYGILSISSSLAYGTWEFDWWQSSVGLNSLRIYYVSFVSNPTGINATASTYHMFWNLGGSSFAHQRNSGDTVVDAENFRSTGFSSTGTWYRIKVVRETGGLTNVYAKGGGFGSDFTLLTETSGANPFTDNTITTSRFFSIVLRGNSAITNIISYS